MITEGKVWICSLNERRNWERNTMKIVTPSANTQFKIATDSTPLTIVITTDGHGSHIWTCDEMILPGKDFP